MPVCVVHTLEEEREDTLLASAESRHPATQQILQTTCRQTNKQAAENLEPAIAWNIWNIFKQKTRKIL